MVNIETNPMEVLKKILALWPYLKDENNHGNLHQFFSEFITDDFNYANFTNQPNGEFSIFSEMLILGDEAKILVYDTVESDHPNLAVLFRGADKKWRLKSFLFQCASCFGEGVLNGEPCNTCFAIGWGTANWS